MLVERLVQDFPFAAGFKEREKVRVSIAIPVLEFEPYGGDRVDDVDAHQARPKRRRRGIAAY